MVLFLGNLTTSQRILLDCGVSPFLSPRFWRWDFSGARLFCVVAADRGRSGDVDALLDTARRKPPEGGTTNGAGGVTTIVRFARLSELAGPDPVVSSVLNL